MENGNENKDVNAEAGSGAAGVNKKSYALPIAILAAGLLIAGAVAFRPGSGANDSAPTPAAKESGAAATVERTAITADDDAVLGNPDASVTFINFGDFRCRYCKLFQETIKPAIMEKYVKTGKVKYVYRDLITMGDNSILAAGGANCAGEQGKYWEFADTLHSGEGGHNTVYTEDSLSQMAVSLGLDAGKFRQCLDSKEYVKEVKKDTEEARAAGATGTPTVFINGRIIVGLASLGEYEKIIDEELAKAAAEGK
ncbi:MAG: DsbA family protein [bacterium]|nr:DsbA family protein [bacterium]